MCCKVMEIPALEKPSGMLCRHVVAGRGCGIHGTHPAACRVFACLWLREPTLPHKFRPDQTKVVMATDVHGTRLTAYCDPANPLAWRREPIRGFLRDQAQARWGTGFAIVAKAGARTWMIGPKGDVDLGDLDDRSPLQIEQGPDGVPKVTILAPIPEGEDVEGAVERLRAESRGD